MKLIKKYVFLTGSQKYFLEKYEIKQKVKSKQTPPHKFHIVWKISLLSSSHIKDVRQEKKSSVIYVVSAHNF